MVRRRPRATKIISAGVTTTTTTNEVAAAVAASNGNLLEDQYFASPKRKDCKVDMNGVDVEFVAILSECVGNTNQANANANGDDNDDDAVDNCKRNHNAAVGKSTGVPFTTRSQTKTIENFFKAKTAETSAPLKGAEKLKTNNHSSKTYSSNSQPPQIIAINGYNEEAELLAAALHDDRLPHGGDCNVLMPQYIFDLSEDTNDTDNTELSDETGNVVSVGTISIVGVNDFMAHRSSSMRDSHSSSRSSFATDNIFLQEPVLTLNVDKTPNQASSIKINRSLEIGPIFSSPPSLNASVLNGRFNQIVSLNGTSSKRDSFSLDTKPLLPDNDNSSCDSGVAFTSSVDNQSPNVATSTLPQTRRRKPATPHRIVCPSPVKAAPRMASPNACASKGLSPSTRKINSAKEQLSPRKSPRHATSASSKTRRRLNPQPDKPPCSTFSVASVQNDTKQNGHEADDAHNVVQDEEFETVLKSANHSSAKTTNGIINPKCSTKGHSKSTKSSNCVKIQQQPKNKHQFTQPLASTNGNRELTEFFPVRRSVRKTKTAVKEEMMRNLEQAVIEERAEGLKIAHFEGKGRGVTADRRFQRGEFVVEYVGDLISMTEASEREKRYALDENAGCYMYYFKHKNQQYCIDATEDTGKLGRLVNHSRNGNLITKVVVVKQRPHLILIAKDDIEPGEEITYDYGDRSKESLLHHPWLAF